MDESDTAARIADFDAAHAPYAGIMRREFTVLLTKAGPDPRLVAATLCRLLGGELRFWTQTAEQVARDGSALDIWSNLSFPEAREVAHAAIGCGAEVEVRVIAQ